MTPLFDRLADFYITLSIAYIALIAAAVILTTIITLLLRPRGRLEWATAGFFASLAMVVALRYWVNWFDDDGEVDHTFGSCFLGVQCLLVAAYLYALFLEWRPALVDLWRERKNWR